MSTINQKIERQLIKSHPNECIYIDVVSGSKPFKDRPKGQQLLADVKAQKIDHLNVHSIDRLGRNLFDILHTLEVLHENQVNLKVDNLGMSSLVNGKPNSAFKLIISVMANIAEMERETLLERQREGIVIAKAKGVYKGRVKGSVESHEVFLSKYKDVTKYLRKGYSLRDTARMCRISLATVQKVKRLY